MSNSSFDKNGLGVYRQATKVSFPWNYYNPDTYFCVHILKQSIGEWAKLLALKRYKNHWQFRGLIQPYADCPFEFVRPYNDDEKCLIGSILAIDKLSVIKSHIKENGGFLSVGECKITFPVFHVRNWR